MKGLISRAAVAAGLTAGLVAAVGGCCGYYDVVDPCYPQRYEYAARKEVCEARYQQVHNGHVLDQTVWNWMFATEDGKPSAKLNGAGMDHLIYLVRRRPCPDSTIYLATAHDIKYANDKFEPVTFKAFTEARVALDQQREKAIYDFVNAQTDGRGLVFHVERHDPAEPDLAAEIMAREIATRGASFTGTLGSAAGGAAAAPPGR